MRVYAVGRRYDRCGVGVRAEISRGHHHTLLGMFLRSPSAALRNPQPCVLFKVHVVAVNGGCTDPCT